MSISASSETLSQHLVGISSAATRRRGTHCEELQFPASRGWLWRRRSIEGLCQLRHDVIEGDAASGGFDA